jgi:hypothetical protein
MLFVFAFWFGEVHISHTEHTFACMEFVYHVYAQPKFIAGFVIWTAYTYTEPLLSLRFMILEATQHTHTHANTCTHTHKHMHTHMHIHIHTLLFSYATSMDFSPIP